MGGISERTHDCPPAFRTRDPSGRNTMNDLHQRFVFLSASLPTRDRRAESGPYSPSEISDAVTALTRLILEGNGRLVCGGHPTINPLLLWTARELQAREQIVIYQ